MSYPRPETIRCAGKRALLNRRGMTAVDAFVILMLLSLCAVPFSILMVKRQRVATDHETKTQLNKVALQLERYKQRHASALPEDLNALLDGDFTELPKDGWHQPFVYRKLNDTEHKLFSKGPDEIENTEDDIKSFRSR